MLCDLILAALIAVVPAPAPIPAIHPADVCPSIAGRWRASGIPIVVRQDGRHFTIEPDADAGSPWHGYGRVNEDGAIVVQWWGGAATPAVGVYTLDGQDRPAGKWGYVAGGGSLWDGDGSFLGACGDVWTRRE